MNACLALSLLHIITTGYTHLRLRHKRHARHSAVPFIPLQTIPTIPNTPSYPYVFLNDKPFDDTFKKMTSGIASGKTSYGLIPEEHWSKHPSWIDEERATKAREEMVQKNVIYGDSVPYREMCRYQSGFFYRHELLKD